MGGRPPRRSPLARRGGGATRELSKTPKKPTTSDERAAAALFAKHPALKGVRVRVRGGVCRRRAFRKALGGVDWGRRAQPAAEEERASPGSIDGHLTSVQR